MSELTLWQGDCLELMKNIPDKSVDMILCDLLYGTTNNKWDKKNRLAGTMGTVQTDYKSKCSYCTVFANAVLR